MDRITELEEQVQHLRERVGHWKRLAKDQRPRNRYLKESHQRSGDADYHYIHLVLQKWPKDMPLKDTLSYVKEKVLPEVYPYRYQSCYRTARLGWVVVLWWFFDDSVDMDYTPPEK